MNQNIYLDNNATTLIDKRVLQQVIGAYGEELGNPSSIHTFGRAAKVKLIQAREEISAFLGVQSSEIFFTSGGTEGINLVLRGLCSGQRQGHIITSGVEHAAVYSTVKSLETGGWEATYLMPGLWGAVSSDSVKAAIRSDTRLIVLLAANNETGVKTDIASVAEAALQAQIPFVVDGVSLLGKEIFSIPEGVSAMCFSSHKVHGPKGVGFVFIRRGVKIKPTMTGGEQEFGLRAGTENVPGVIGMAKAISLLEEELPGAVERVAELRDRFERAVQGTLKGVKINGQGPRMGNTSNLCFEGVDGESLLIALDLAGVAASHGSACASGALEPSRILLNMGLSMKDARSSVRFSLSRFTTEEEVERAAEIVCREASRLRRGC
jgi:cysteine desulfurase